MFEDYEGLKITELRSLKIRLISAVISLILFANTTMINSSIATGSAILFGFWYLAQWPFLSRQNNLTSVRRFSNLNFLIDFSFVTLAVINSGRDPYWAAFTVYSLLVLQGNVLFGLRGGLLTTSAACIITLIVSVYRVSAVGIQEPLTQTGYRLSLVLITGVFTTYALNRVWISTRQSARTGALDELNRNLVASEVISESQLYVRMEASVRKLMRADSFMLALFPTALNPQKLKAFDVKSAELFPAIITINRRFLSLLNQQLGWSGNFMVRQCLKEGPVQENVPKFAQVKLADEQKNKPPWYLQYTASAGSYLYAPIVVDGVTLGVISVQRNLSRNYDLSSLALFEQLATLCGTALNNVRVTHMQQRRISELALLNQISSDLAQTSELAGMIVKLRSRLLDFFEAQNVRFVLNLATEETEPEISLRVGSLEGITESGIRRTEQALLQNLMQRRESLLIGDLSQYEACPEVTSGPVDESEDDQPAPKGSYIAVPLIFDNEIFGALAVSHPQINRYFESDLQLLETIAHHTTTVIQNLRLQRQTLHNLEEVRELYYMLMSKEGELRREAEERARFEGVVLTARTIGHEIGQPLTAILGLVSMARAGLHLEAHDLEILEQETLRSRDIIGKLRSVVRYETKPYVNETSMLDLDASSSSKLGHKDFGRDAAAMDKNQTLSSDEVQTQMLVDNKYAPTPPTSPL